MTNPGRGEILESPGFRLIIFAVNPGGLMRVALIFFCFAVLISALQAQQTSAAPIQPASAPTTFADDLKQPAVTPEAKLKKMFEEKIQAEWEALKNQDKKAYGDLLANDYEGVEVDGKGERTRAQATSELVESNIDNYTLWGFKLIPLGPEADLAVYEITILFPRKSAIRYSRLYISELWMKQSEEWKIVHYQETHVK
jgi:hypothetical protein